MITVSIDAVPPKEAALQLGITTMTLWRWIRDGKLIAVKVAGMRLIPLSEIKRLKAGRV